MSFSKARIQRFNELTSQVPPPGAYDPKFDSKVKGSVAIGVEKTSSRQLTSDASTTNSVTKSFAGSCSSLDCASSVCSRNSANPTSIKPFRTPQIPKKRAVVKPNATTSCPRARTKLYRDGKDAQQQEVCTPQELSELKAELQNRDKTIVDYEKLVEDMKLKTRNLDENCRVLQMKLETIEQQHQLDIESMSELQQQVMENANEKHLKQLQILKTELLSSTVEYEQKIDENNHLVDQLRDQISRLEQDLAILRDDRHYGMSQLDVACEQQVGEELNATLILKDLEMADLLKVQLETECQLQSVQNKLEESEKQVTELESKLANLTNSMSTTLDQQLAQQIISALQEYFNDATQWNSSKYNFHSDVDSFLSEIKKLASDLKLSYEREIELSRDHFNEERENLEQQLDHQKALIKDLQSQLAETRDTNNFLTEELQDVQKLYKDMSRSLQDSKDEVDRLEIKLSDTINGHQTELKTVEGKHYEEVTYLHGLIEEAKNEYLQEVEKLETSLEEEKNRMKDCADKMIENAEAVTRETLQACRAESEEKVRRIISETEAKIRDTMKASEEKENKYKGCLERLESEKSSLSSSLSQREVEVNRLTVALEEMKCTAETQESFSQSLQAELDRAEAELVEKKEELRNLKDQLRNESAEMVARRRRFEVVMAENQASVGALTQRLAQSQIDNDALQRQLQIKENGLEEYRKLLETISQNSTALQDQLDCIADNIDHKLDYIGQLETANINQINLAKNNLLSNIDHFKSLAIQQIAQSRHKSDQNAELKVNLRQMSERLNDATDMLLRLEEVNDEQSLEISKLQLKIGKLQQQSEEKDRQIHEIKASNDMYLMQHETEIVKINEQLTKVEQEARMWQRKHTEIEGERDHLKELTTKYENQLASLESEKIMRRLQQSEEKSKQSLEVTDGQKTKQIYQLKDKIDLFRLRQELDARCGLMDEVAGQISEKLKLEARRQIGMGKENALLSPSHKQLFPKSANTTPVSSPNKHHPATPLRARND